MRILLLSLLLLASPAAAKPQGGLRPEAGLNFGGSWGMGSVSQFGSSFALGGSFAVPVHDAILFGFEGGGNFQHFRRNQQNFGRAGKEHFDEKINLFQLAALFRYAFELSEYFDLRPTAGLGFYQVNTFEGCRSVPANGCADHESVVHTTTDNYFGLNYGLQFAFKLGEGLVLGPEIRIHQLLGGGRRRSPAFFSPSLSLSGRF